MRILIVGLGAIGAGFDSPEGIENHAEVSLKRGFNLIGGVDLNLERRLAFKSSFQAPVFQDLLSANHLKPDVVVIATPPQSHLGLLEDVLKIFPNAMLICEKPFGLNQTDSIKMAELISNQNARLYVNYSRQFSKGFHELRTGIQGELRSGTVTYNYGLSRSCSHYIRLCISLFGRPERVEALQRRDNSPENPSFSLKYGSGVEIDFFGTENLGVRIADFNFVTRLEVINIQQANNWEILEINSDSSPKWIRELQKVKSGDLIGGMTNLYSKLIANSSSEFNHNLMDDLLPNSIIHEVNSHE
jgi:predicted dehydrogenase